jgi:hypothetical protein
MPAAPTTRTFKDYPDPESLLTYEEYGDSIFDVIDFLLNPPMVHLVQTTAQSQTNSAWTTMNWQSAEVDTHGYHVSTNPSRITPTVPGIYKGWLGASWVPHANSAVGRRLIGLVRSDIGVAVPRRDSRGAAFTNTNLVMKGIRFYVVLPAAGEYLEMQTWQNSGAALNTDVTSYQERPEIHLRWWRPLP